MKLTIYKEIWSLAKSFNIARVKMIESYMIVVKLQDGEHIGRGECEVHESDISYFNLLENYIEQYRTVIEKEITTEKLQSLLPSGPVRNAIDCALWDLKAKKMGQSIWNLMHIDTNIPITTAYTIGINSPEEMGKEARENNHRPLLKLKLDGSNNLERLQAVRRSAKDSDIIIDANESWSYEQLNALSTPLYHLGVSLIEQPLPAAEDKILEQYAGPVPLCADESCHDRSSLSNVLNRYQYINVKLDKTGGLTEALALTKEAKKIDLKIMVGCMTGTSLAMAPAMIIGAQAEFCDLDGPLLLKNDRDPGIIYDGSIMNFPGSDVWG